jgi:serine protease Do
MKTCFIATTALALSVCTLPAMSQSKQLSKEKNETKSEETVIIRNRSGNTTVEVKDGEVFINGEKMEKGYKSSSNKKIIIKSDAHNPGMNWFDAEEIEMPARKAMLGIYTKTDEEIDGAAVDMVSPNSGADKAGLRKGDIITRIDDIGIKDGKQLTELISKHDVGDKVAITYDRNGKLLHTDAVLSPIHHDRTVQVFSMPRGREEMSIPNNMRAPFMLDINSELSDASPKMGATVEDLADGNGVRVLGTKPGSPAENAGLVKNDVIKKMNGETVLTVDDLQSIISSSKRNEAIDVTYERKGKVAKTKVTFPKTTRKKDL